MLLRGDVAPAATMSLRGDAVPAATSSCVIASDRRERGNHVIARSEATRQPYISVNYFKLFHFAARLHQCKIVSLRSQ